MPKYPTNQDNDNALLIKAAQNLFEYAYSKGLVSTFNPGSGDNNTELLKAICDITARISETAVDA